MIGPDTQVQVTNTKAVARLVEQAKRVTLPLTHSAGRQPTAVRLLKPRACGKCPDESRRGSAAVFEPMLCCRLAASSRRAHPSPVALRLA